MCTASWLFHNNGYSLFFNRDEKLTRSRAIPPSIIQTDRGTALMPIDPDGGGSWIGVNSRGWTYALLNYYQGSIPEGTLTSRGNIIRQVLNCDTVGQLEHQFDTLQRTQFAPFSLLCIAPQYTAPAAKPPEQCEQNHTVLQWQWNGIAMLRHQVSGLITSSSKHFDEVHAARTRTATRIDLSGGFPNDVHQQLTKHHDYHRSHNPGRGAKSVCMHRDDARTVSHSDINVSGNIATFNYFDGSPCEADTPLRNVLKLTTDAPIKATQQIHQMCHP